MSIYLTGSMAFDRIMHFPGKFMDAILPDQIHNLNVSFFIDSLQEKFGGNAGNIAYSLALLQERPIIVASVGSDFSRYRSHLENQGLGCEGIRLNEDVLTASAYIITDQSNNQITGFHAAAMMRPSEYDFSGIDSGQDIALIGPSNMDDMNNHAAFYRQKGVRYIYDPGQQIPMTSREQLLDAIGGCHILIGNDYEIRLIMNLTGRTKQELLEMTTLGLVTTYGEKGSSVSLKAGPEEHVQAVPVTTVLDPTGAGDAYRAGLIKGLIRNRTLAESARLGSTCAAYCIERDAPQGHTFTMDEFNRRHHEAFGCEI